MKQTTKHKEGEQGEEEQQQQQLQHTYLSKTFKQQQICFKNFKYYKNKRKKQERKTNKIIR